MRARENIGEIAEEIANSVTHGVGLGMSLAGFAVLVAMAAEHGDPVRVASCAIYGLTLVGLYAASTLYHSFLMPNWKRVLRIVDHSAIYLLIAGTSTPFLLVYLWDPWGWAFLTGVWLFALGGIVFKVFFIGRYPRLSLLLYLLLSWSILLALKPILAIVPPRTLIWLLTGGLFYTAGVWFYVQDGRRFYHAIWHLFVLAGSACHYFAVMMVVAVEGKA